MVSCAACGYSQTSRSKKLGVTFHSFPKDEFTRNAWIKFVNEPDWVPKDSAVLCSSHFTGKCFDLSSMLKVRLFQGSLPTIQVERAKYGRFYDKIYERPATLESAADGQVERTGGESLLKSNREIRKISQEGEKFVFTEVKVECEEENSEDRGLEEVVELKPQRPLGDEILRVCRTCLRMLKVEDTVPLFMQEPSGQTELYRKLRSVLQLDLFPVEHSCLCKNCVNFIKAVHDFRTTCKVNEDVLRDFDWEGKTRNLLHVVDQEELKDLYEEMTAVSTSAEALPPSDFLQRYCTVEMDPEEFWSELNDKSNGLSDLEDHWYDEGIKHTTDHDYAASGSIKAETDSANIPKDDNLFSPAFDAYFKRRGSRLSVKLKRRCRRYHHKDEGNGPFICEFCGKLKATKVAFNNHHRLHSKGFQCTECSEFTYDRFAYLRHCKMVHGGMPKCFKCQLCEKRYHVQKLLDTHMETHQLENSDYICKICKKIFNNMYNLEKHKAQHRAQKISCKLCGIKVYKQALAGHLKWNHANFGCKSSKKIYKCHLCGNKYPKEGSLELHKKQAHGLKRQENPIQSEEMILENYEVFDNKIVPLYDTPGFSEIDGRNEVILQDIGD